MSGAADRANNQCMETKKLKVGDSIRYIEESGSQLKKARYTKLDLLNLMEFALRAFQVFHQIMIGGTFIDLN